MPKLKTNKSARKRFKMMPSGKIKRKRANLRHILTGRGKKRKRQLRKGAYIATVDLMEIKRLLPYG